MAKRTHCAAAVSRRADDNACRAAPRLSTWAPALLGLWLAAGDAAAAIPSNLADLSLEELASIQVTSVSKRAEALADAPASVYVISADDIRRSGATTLPEALRLAPLLQVARIDARNYAISARGFNNPFSNKLLVMIDGRTIYSPLFSGVFWDAQDVVLEDIDRIEVISGAGGTLWGANAVNGVINIITRSAADTQGTLVDLGAGERQKSAAVRYGGKLAGGHYRIYGKHADQDDLRRESGAPDHFGWRRDQAGFRADWGTARDTLTFQGDAYEGTLHQFGTRDIRIAGANLLGRMSRALGPDSDLRLQAYIDHTERDQPLAYDDRLTTFDIEAQHAIRLGKAHNVVWGGGYRLGQDRIRNDVAFAFLPESLDMRWANLFAQDEIELRPDLKLTLGLKLENNSYTGTEKLPTARLAWKPAEGHLLWGSVSRAVRAPSRIDRDLYTPANPRIVGGVPQYLVGGGPNFDSETVKAYEIGYRAQPRPTLWYSAVAFYDDYDRLRTLGLNPGGPGLITFQNQAEGEIHGVELTGGWQVLPAWRLTGGLVVQRQRLRLKPGAVDMSGGTGLANNDANRYWTLRSSWDIDARRQLDLMLRHVGDLPRPEVPAYTSLDLRFGWRVTPDLELSLIGQNLLNASHVEFGAAGTRVEYERGIFLKAVWQL
jgi:iron complex outermembrane receptor protein